VNRLVVLDAPLDCSGVARGEERAPAALRDAGLLARLGGHDGGEADARIDDPRRDPATGVVGADQVRRASRAIASEVRAVLDARDQPLVLGGDCTILLGVSQALPADSGLWFIDGHADFFDGESSPTGEAADMDLAILTGHGPRGLLESHQPLLAPAVVVLLGHRPSELNQDVARENARLDPAIHALTSPDVSELGAATVGIDAAARLAERPSWLHLDLDVLDEEVMPAVSYPLPLGLDWDELIGLVRPLASAPNLLGVSVADFNPDQDVAGAYATQVVEALASMFGR
jgi:arginase family enzyme